MESNQVSLHKWNEVQETGWGQAILKLLIIQTLHKGHEQYSVTWRGDRMLRGETLIVGSHTFPGLEMDFLCTLIVWLLPGGSSFQMVHYPRIRSVQYLWAPAVILPGCAFWEAPLLRGNNGPPSSQFTFIPNPMQRELRGYIECRSNLRREMEWSPGFRLRGASKCSQGDEEASSSPQVVFHTAEDWHFSSGNLWCNIKHSEVPLLSFGLCDLLCVRLSKCHCTDEMRVWIIPKEMWLKM